LSSPWLLQKELRGLQDAILNNTRRYRQLIAEAVDQALPVPTTDIVEDIFDVMERQVFLLMLLIPKRSPPLLAVFSVGQGFVLPG
jgi:hypothetical protein